MKITEITSKDNEKIKALRKLNQRKYRDKLGKFFVENLSIINDAARSGFFPELIFVTEAFLEKNKEKLQAILENSEVKESYIITVEINRSFSNLDNPSGIAAVYLKPDSRIDFSKPVVYLNKINDPGNLGTILRSALAFDLTNIVVDEKSADIYNFKTINAAKDSIFKVNMDFDKGGEIINKIKSKMPVYSSVVKDGKELGIINKENPFCIVLGSEARGVDDGIQKISDGLITIKTAKKIESLNVASASAIIFSEIYNK